MMSELIGHSAHSNHSIPGSTASSLAAIQCAFAANIASNTNADMHFTKECNGKLI